MKLSIIIPCWNAEPYISELLGRLDGQMRDDVEVIVVDDGSDVPFKTAYSWCKVVRKKNGGCSTARNKGLDLAKGEYISFIDADDLVPTYFVERLIKETESKPDVIDFSWKSLDGKQHNHVLKTTDDRLSNPSVCTRAFRKDFIGDIRFNEKKDSTEDEDFSRKIGYADPTQKINRAVISDYMYYYRANVSDSKIKRFKKGLMKTKRVVYYYNHVTKNMTDLLAEIKKEDELNEVLLLTNKCDIPEMRRYCQVRKPMSIWAHELRGEPYSRVTIIEPPLLTQVVLYCEYANKIGGIPTFMYNFCQRMKDHYDITVLYDRLDATQVVRLKKIVRCMRNDGRHIACDTIIVNRLTDKIPENVDYKKSVQLVHCCKQKTLDIPKDRDVIVNVSQAAKDSWGDVCKDGIVINNPSYTETNKAIMIVSATRIGVIDKGKNEERMRKLNEMLWNSGISYVWMNFSDHPLENMIGNFVNLPSTLNVQDYIKKADYCCLLSDQEACSMTILEALTNNTAVIATPFPSLFEEGFVDGKTGYVIPFDMKFDVNKLLKVPKFRFKYDNEKIVDQWKELLGNTTPKKDYVPDTSMDNDMVTVKALRMYWDEEMNRHVYKKEIFRVFPDRANFLVKDNKVVVL